MTTTKATSPILTLNGSGYAHLGRQYEEASEALRAAIKAMPCPHPRDYYTVDGLYEKAKAEDQQRLEALREVLNQLEAIELSLSSQDDARHR